MDKIKILKVEPGKPPCVKEIANDFKASQEEVEGDIECVGFGDGCVAVINAEGKLNGMQPNRRNGDDIICGPFFICGDTPDGDFISLTEQQIEEYTRRFGEIEQFTGQEPELEPHMTILAFYESDRTMERKRHRHRRVSLRVATCDVILQNWIK